MSAEQAKFFSDKGAISFDAWSLDELRAEVRGLYKGYPDTSVATRQELIEVLEGNRHVSDLTVKKADETVKLEYKIKETERPTKKPWWQTGQYE